MLMYHWYVECINGMAHDKAILTRLSIGVTYRKIFRVRVIIMCIFDLYGKICI